MTSSTHASINPSLSSVSAPSRPARMGGVVQQYRWIYQGQAATIAYETLGAADRPTVLLLPAFSTVSTRAELSKIAQVLASHFQVIAMDWLGFGDSDRPAYPYGRPLYQQLLTDFVQACCPQPAAILAAGHAAGYALHLARAHKGNAKLLLVAPTWKGPFRAMGAPSWVAAGVRNLVRSPLLGQTLYGLNTQPAFLKWMYQRHVYADSTQLTSAFMEERHRITQHSGARFAPGAFVTGGLDPMVDRSEWIEVATSVATDVAAASSDESVPNTAVHIIVSEKAPPKSSAEMAALSAVPYVQTHSLPGSLGVYEEYGAEVGAIALDYFQSTI